MDASAFKIFPASVVSDAGDNGGPHAFLPIAAGAFANLFRKVTGEEATAGITLYRKAFLCPHDPAGAVTDELRAGWAAIQGDQQISPDATWTDTQADITPGTMRWYGAGTLYVSALAGVSSLQIAVADGTHPGIEDGDELVITDASGAREIATVSGAPVVAGDLVTLTLAAPTTAPHSATTTTVSARFAASPVYGRLSGSAVVSTTGSLTCAGTSITFHPQGAVYDVVTLTFSSPTAFAATGQRVASYGSGTKGVDFAPSNTAWGKPYFSIPAAALGGTAVAGDTVTFTTLPAQVPAWVRWIVPAGTVAGQTFRSSVGMSAFGA